MRAGLDIDSAMNQMRRQHKGLLSVLDAFNASDGNVGAINESDLLSFPLHEWVQLNNDVWIKRRNNVFDNILNFDTIIKNGGGFGDHYHQWLMESCEVISGKIVDLNTGKEYKDGDIAEFGHEVAHHIFAEPNARLKVLFKKQTQP